ncbi:MAG: DEAD/DEAH box helicase [Candidatus Thorarchaeota archaeon]|jgi:ATP-dependent helicase IRC3
MLEVRLVNNRNGKLIGDKRDIDQVRKFLTVEDPEARFKYAYKQGFWDGLVYFVSDKGFFYVGLAPKIVKFCKSSGIKVRVTDGRGRMPIPKKFPTKLGDTELRDYQYDTVERALTRKLRGIPFPRGIISAATNAGKSLMAAAIFKSVNVPCLYLCHKIEILDQVFNWLSDYFDDYIGVYNSKSDMLENITVAMITTLYARRGSEDVEHILKRYKCLVVDEAHHASSDSWFEIIHRSRAYYKFGLSGTALVLAPNKNLKVIGVLGPKIKSATNVDLVEKGYSAFPQIIMKDYKQEDLKETDESVKVLMARVKRLIIEIKKRREDGEETSHTEASLQKANRKLYQRVYEVGICKSVARADALVDIVRNHPDQQILVVVSKINHGEFLQARLKRFNFDSVFVSGGDSDDMRIAIKRGFSNGKIRVLISTMIYKEGVDVPAIDVLVIAVGEKSPVTILQVFGRGLRRREDKSSVPVYDFNDGSHKVLERHTAERILIYKREGFAPKFE